MEQVDSQLIIRFPEEIADKIRAKISNNEEISEEELKKGLDIEITPFINRTEGHENMQFGIKYEDFNSTGTLMELPNILESYKTLDRINVFKSNDISQLIYVHPKNEKSLEEGLN